MDACRADGLSKRTIDDYQNKLTKFIWWWNKHYIEIGNHPRCVTVKEVRAFAAYLREPNRERWGITKAQASNNKHVELLSAASIAAYGRSVKAFFNWLEREGYIAQSPFNRSVKFTSKYQSDKTLKTVSDSDLEKIFDALNQKRMNYAGCRNLAIISLLLDSGIRRGELLSMRVSDIDLEHGRVQVRGKTGQRTAFFSEIAKRALVEYYTGYREKQGNQPDSFWLTLDGRPLSSDGFSTMIRIIEAEAGVRFYAHQLRHNYATWLASTGANVFSLMQLLGHSSISNTKIYVNQNADTLQKEFVERSPLTKLVKKKRAAKTKS